MSAELFEYQLRGYKAVLGALGALTQDICADCLMMKGAKIRLGKGLKKLETDIAGATLSMDAQKELVTQAQRFAAMAEALSQATEYPCKKTAKQCLLGEGCFVTGAFHLMEEIPAQLAAGPSR